MIRIPLSKLRAYASIRPVGYVDAVVQAGVIKEGIVELDSAAYVALRKRYGVKGVGDKIERAVKGVARLVGAECLDEQNNLKPESGCAQRRDAINATLNP